jgi:hypothetical protein
MQPNEIIQSAIKALGKRVVETPVLPFLPKSVNLKNLATRPPGTFTSLDPGSMYGNFQQDPKAAMMNTVMALSTGPQPVKKLGINQIDDAIDTIRGRMGDPTDQMAAINDLFKFGKENLSPSELKIANKGIDPMIDSVIGKFQDPIIPAKQPIQEAIDGLKNNIGKKLDLTSTPKPSTGGEIGGNILYHGSDKVFDEMKVGQPTKRRMMMGEYDTTSHGMFFTPDKKIAGEYGKNVGEYRVNVKNPLDFRDRKNDAIFNEFDKLIANDPTIDMKPGEPGFSEFMYFDGELGKKFTQFIKNKGFDGAKLTETSEFSKGTFDTIVALDNAQVKNNKSLSGEIPKGVKK